MKNEELNPEENIPETTENQAHAETAASDKQSNQEDEVTQLEQLKKELAEQNDKFLRLYSEFDNFRRRTAREKLDIVKNASEDVIKQLLPILDDFERAIQNNENVEDSVTLKEGFTLIYNKLKSGLESKGLTAMGEKGEVFDTDKHEALTNIPAPDEKDKGKVIEVIEKGYILNDKIIRFAKVVVGN